MFDKYKFEYNSRKKLIIGIIDINKSQHGYVNSGLFKDDIFIDRKNRLNSLNGDTVSINIINAKKATLAGKVIEVIKRRYTKFIGTIKKDGNYNFFIPDNSKTGSDFFIPEEKLNGAQNNDRVIVEFIKWPTSAGCPFGAVIKILSNNIDLKNYINSTIETLNLRNSFSKKFYFWNIQEDKRFHLQQYLFFHNQI